MTDGEKIMQIATIAYRSNEVNQEIWRLFKKHVDISNLYLRFSTGCGCPNDISHRWNELISDCLNNPSKYDVEDLPIVEGEVQEPVKPKKNKSIIKKR